jgi:hypothetical protein
MRLVFKLLFVLFVFGCVYFTVRLLIDYWIDSLYRSHSFLGVMVFG